MPDPDRPPLKLGITGTMAAGKSLVGRCLANLGVPVLDTDQVVADLYRCDTALVNELVAAFGTAILAADGQVSKPALAARVFTDPDRLKTLEGLVHPRVRAAVSDFCTGQPAASLAPVRAVLVPLLFEGGTAAYYDAVWCVAVTPESELMARLQARNPAMDPTEAAARLKRQWSQAEKSAAADVTLDNSGTPEATCAQVQAALAALMEKYHAPRA